MTREAIIENCRRLLSFFKENDKRTDHQILLNGVDRKEDISCSGLLRSYERILDYYGSPPSFMSRLYLSGEDYAEFAEHAKVYKNYREIQWPHITAIGFEVDGYNWIVENK